MNRFERWIGRLERRARLARAARTSSLALLVSLSATMAGLGLEIFTGRLLPWWVWLSANLLVALGAFSLGWFYRLDMARLLYGADRRIGWGERLITLYELKAEKSAFASLLEAQWERMIERQPAAFDRALEHQTYGRWVGVFALGLVCLALTNYEGLLASRPATMAETNDPAPQKPGVEARSPLPQSGAVLVAKLEEWRQRLNEARAALTQNPDDPRAQAALQQLQAEISEAQDRLVPAPPTANSPPDSSFRSREQAPDLKPTDEPGGPLGSRHQGSGEDKLDQLLRDLQAVQAQARALSPEELTKLLQDLRSQNPQAFSLIEGLTDSMQTPEEFSRQLEEAIKQLEEQRALQQQLSDLQRELQDALASRSGHHPADERSGQSQSESANELSSGKAPIAGEGEGPRHPDGNSQPSGAKGTAPLDPQAERDLPDLSELQERIRQIPVKGVQEEQLHVLFEIFQTAMPDHSQVLPRQRPTQIDYQKVEALLDALAVPTELRATVRQYFLSLAQKSP
ncbi:MAG: hypothetical protein NZ610_00280 [Candidatus Bipolaricaulota bacterium]|nr:hypothetical protein [Candidatus Bipolaricaulota bacterium]MCS7273835.1 hypothetical protein [Candidatus Bipolaricaulota bacterium]MDW8110747.1 hypothetical protein [Candidatus Bipolaricaulota bacterium]